MLRRKLSFILPILFVTTVWLTIWLTSSPSQASLLAAEHQHDFPRPNQIAQVEPAVPVEGYPVEYANVNGETITGYLARPANTERLFPGIIAIHEWWGLNDNIRAMTERLAGEGYQVLAVDLYNGQVAETPEMARQLMESVEEAIARQNLEQAYNYLSTDNRAPQIGVIGWCFGGSWSLKTALLFPQGIDATVIYYGGDIGEATAEELRVLQMPILGIFGAEDQSIPVSEVEEFESILKELGKQVQVKIYQGAGHAFANPSGTNYVPEAAEEAWELTTEFLDRHLTVDRSTLLIE